MKRKVKAADLKKVPTSVTIIDPKGEMAIVTKRAKGRVTTFNPLAMADADAKSFPANAAALADGMVKQKRRKSKDADAFWNQSARKLLAGVVMAELANLDSFKSIAAKPKPRKKPGTKKPR